MGPDALASHALAYDSARNRTVLLFTINPNVAVPGDTVTFDVTLVGPAGPAGQTVPVTDTANNPMLDVFVPAGNLAGQLVNPLDPNLGSMMALPAVFDLIATAGGVSIPAQLTINP